MESIRVSAVKSRLSTAHGSLIDLTYLPKAKNEVHRLRPGLLDCLSGCPGRAKAPLRFRKEKELVFGRRDGGHNEGAQLGPGDGSGQ